MFACNVLNSLGIVVCTASLLHKISNDGGETWGHSTQWTLRLRSHERCNSTASCHGLVGYKAPNETTLAAVQSLFGVPHLRSILGANDLLESTPANATVRQGQIIRIPFDCSCSNGTGTSRKIPVYTVRSNDTLSGIATNVFSSLVTFQDIAAASNITNPNIINVGQHLKIPLPCSCDPVDGEKVVHYAHLVASGSSVEEISRQFNVSADALLRLNKLASDSDLEADVAIDVPLKACSSMISNDSLDSSLLVSNGTYVFTANNCVKCSCSFANNMTLQCQPSQISPSNGSVCPSMLCQGTDLYIGNSTISSCNRTTCNYAGYKGQAILTSLANESTCPGCELRFISML
ncbi:hypothetical protein CRG98_046494 [Punica granatum]|uniref:LysM domain-containing protein n=1 Tax=Punica granatum TaxID=22663 RepID=A0A2I0HN22_PUNGR|nr:hypothetical protein CRG98_046494 [Punica granatum]